MTRTEPRVRPWAQSDRQRLADLLRPGLTVVPLLAVTGSRLDWCPQVPVALVPVDGVAWSAKLYDVANGDDVGPLVHRHLLETDCWPSGVRRPTAGDIIAVRGLPWVGSGNRAAPDERYGELRRMFGFDVRFYAIETEGCWAIREPSNPVVDMGGACAAG